ncbi:MAG TPA: molecular chaperone DnaK [Polyangiaceae bacterium]|nr:molecular chaperone DnaK [Polyangiaceae bacterium]HNZ21206.1 molecular chaperone DnaK [Polyangiaceae bacterium]HOD21108.1 molecular chaperone DnaK [Polyangiaceae bacterium]HOE48048.1 molecular chaperone DnaK [Polyangiaceae bacterium]HOG99387.1 molecular chaperone DnaK [Polyangiaceae bacterium]
MGKIIGIDLGTTNSCVAVLEDGAADAKPVVIPNSEGARTTPSVVAFTTSGERLVGHVAKRQGITNPEHTVFAVKRLMGRKFSDREVRRQIELAPYRVIEASNGDAWIRGRDREYSPPEISSIVLDKMREVAETYLGEKLTEVVVTVPAYFDDAQRQATKDAGRIAGLEVKRIINEPTAAALAYGLSLKERETIAVYDLGGGTFDISVLQIEGGVFGVRATGGDTHLGGEDFDQRIIDTLAEEFEMENQVDLRKDRMALQRLKEAAEKAKHELSSSLETEINIPFIATGPTGPLHLQRTMKRSDLEILTSDLIDRTLDACRAALQDAKLSARDIDNVVLVGGMTRMPAVQKSVKEFFGKEPCRSVNPDEVVAVGAAIQAAALAGEVDEVLLLDVAPLSIGVETGGGVFFRMIERNRTIPTEASGVFTTSVDNQSFVPVHVLQGEREMAADNRSLAHFELTGIPPAPRGVPKIQVTFRVDANGILHVEARDLGTNRSQAIKVTPTSGLSQDEIDRLVQEGDKFRETDSLRKELAEMRNQAETLLYTTEQALDGYADLLDEQVVAEVRGQAETLRGLLKSSGSFEDIRSAYQELESAAFRIAESMYGSES